MLLIHCVECVECHFLPEHRSVHPNEAPNNETIVEYIGLFIVANRRDFVQVYHTLCASKGECRVQTLQQPLSVFDECACVIRTRSAITNDFRRETHFPLFSTLCRNVLCRRIVEECLFALLAISSAYTISNYLSLISSYL